MEATESLINRLTQDSDERQELWIHYLEHSDSVALPRHLETIRRTATAAQILQIAIWRGSGAEPDPLLIELLPYFSDLEQSVICLLALGATVAEIAGIKDIAYVRVQHVVAVILEHTCWKVSYADEIGSY